MTVIKLPALLAVLLAATTSSGAEPRALDGVRRVVFLGDSITYSGQYIEYLEAVLRLKNPSLQCEFLDLGLPSETVSGLSEPGHAGGQFPRPGLHERLERVLSQTRPELVVACYGMNDGIYYPFSEERFQAYRHGIQLLRDRAEKAGARVVHLTPPVFDPEPIRARTLPAGRDEYREPYEGYDDVLARYADWLTSQRQNGWEVIDIHGPMRAYLDEHRRSDPKFRLAGDGVHADATGHWIIAREVLRHWGLEAAAKAPSGEAAVAAWTNGPQVLKLVQQKQRLLKDPWLTATGHKRPGMARGLPLDEAERKAAAINADLAKLLAGNP